MASEIELKLELPPAAADEVARLRWVRELALGPAKREKLVTVYFDTAKRKLRGRGLSLRIRHAGKRRLQTIKALGNGAQGAFARGEWEREVDRDRPDMALAAGTPLEKLATKKLKRKLKPVFETAIQRTSMLLRCDGGDVELAIDRGHVGTGGHRQPITEIELELKRGDPAVLGALAERLARSVPAFYGARAKSERGYALSDGDAAQAVHADRITLADTVSAGDAFTAIGLSCLKQIVSNQDAVRKGEAEGVHQMRIGLRRLRAAVSLFKKMIRGAETAAIKAELKWLTDELGPAREVEVLIESRVRPLRRSEPCATGVGVLEQDLDARRDQALERAKAALDSERYRRLGLGTALWLAQGEWAQTGDPLTAARRDRPASAFAAEVLGKRLRQIVKQIAKLEALNPSERHKLRIAVKKLRYAAEFFASLFHGRKRDARRRHTGKILKTLQGSLGTLNDIEAHKRLAREMIRAGEPSGGKAQKSFAMGFITGQEQKQVAACLAVAEKAGRRLSAARQFWR